MLVALLSAAEPMGGMPDRPRAFTKIAGQSVLELQVEVARSLGAERFVVISQGLPRDLIDVQHDLENDGLAFHAIAGPRALTGLVTSADELLLIADGIIPDFDTAALHVSESRAILALPADPAISQGFERIDRDRAWAGVLRMRGSDAANLAELPPDTDPMSALMRLAAQSGRPIVDLEPGLISDGRWLLLRSEAQAASASRTIVSSRARVSGWTAPCHAIADRLVAARAERLHAPKAAARWTGLSGVLILGLAAGLGWFGYPSTAFAAAAVAGFLFRIGGSLASLFGKATGWLRTRRDQLVGAGLDISLVAIIVFTSGPNAFKMLLFPLVMMLGLLRLAERSGQGWLRSVSSDRMLLLVLLSAAAAAGAILPAVQAIAALTMLSLIVVSFSTRLTRA